VITLHPLTRLGEIKPADDLPKLFSAALAADGMTPQPSDVMVVGRRNKLQTKLLC